MMTRIASVSGVMPVNSSICRAAWRTNMSTPVIVSHPRTRASRIRSVVSGV